MTQAEKVIGYRGCEVVATSTSAATLKCFAIVVRQSLEITSLKIDGIESLTAMGLSGVTLSAGELLTCSGNAFTEIKTAAAGSIMTYKI